MYSATTCSADLSTYSFSVIVSSGTVTSTAGTVTLTGTNIWRISEIPAGVAVTVRVTSAGGCEDILDVTAPNCSCPDVLAPVSGGDKTYCEGGTIPAINATVLAGETIDWYSASSGGVLLSSGVLTYTPAAPGNLLCPGKEFNYQLYKQYTDSSLCNCKSGACAYPDKFRSG